MAHFHVNRANNEGPSVTKPKLYKPSTLNIQMKLILLWVWAERAVLGRAKTALKFKYEIEIG